MAPTTVSLSAYTALQPRTDTQVGHDKASLNRAGVILEAWGEGYSVGAVVILMMIVLCNYRRHVLLHKLILLEMMLSLLHGTFIFLDDPIYGWYLSSTALLLFISYQVHDIVAYLKLRPFLPRWGRRTFVVTLMCVQPFWIIEAWDNFEYFNATIDWNIYTRPWEALFRDPWWIFTTCFLLYKIKTQYEFTLVRFLATNVRLVVMISCMVLSIGFLLADVIVTAEGWDEDTGINPYWRIAFVFKCAADTIFLDDFKSVLDSIAAKSFSKFRFSEVARRNAYVGSESGTATGPVSPTQNIPRPGILQDPGNIAGPSASSDEEMEKGNLSRELRKFSSSKENEKVSLSPMRTRPQLDPLWVELGYGDGAMLVAEHVERTGYSPPASTLIGGDEWSGERDLPKPQQVHSKD